MTFRDRPASVPRPASARLRPQSTWLPAPSPPMQPYALSCGRGCG